MHLVLFILFLHSYSCVIDEGDYFLVTGGGDVVSYNKAVRYDINGWKEDLDNLIQGRWHHGCTQYSNSDGIKVLFIGRLLM